MLKVLLPGRLKNRTGFKNFVVVPPTRIPGVRIMYKQKKVIICTYKTGQSMYHKRTKILPIILIFLIFNH